MKVSKRIIPFFVVFATLLSFVAVPVFAEDDGTTSEYTGTTSFWTWIAGQGDIPAHIVGNIISDRACAESGDGVHHASGYVLDKQNGYYECICQYCGKKFAAYESDIKNSYQKQVDDMPVNGIDNEGGFIWYPTINDIVWDSAYRFSIGESMWGSFGPDVDKLPFSTHYSGSGDFAFTGDKGLINITMFANGTTTESPPGNGSCAICKHRNID